MQTTWSSRMKFADNRLNPYCITLHLFTNLQISFSTAQYIERSDTSFLSLPFEYKKNRND